MPECFCVNNCGFWARATVLSCYRNCWCSQWGQRLRRSAIADKIKAIVSDKVNYHGAQSQTCVVEKRSAKVLKCFLDANDNPDSHQNLLNSFWPIYNVPWNLHTNSFPGICIKSTNEQAKSMRKQLIPFTQVIKFCEISSSRREGFNPNPPTPCVRPCCHSSFVKYTSSLSCSSEAVMRLEYQILLTSPP